jgi:hypothetical protein
MFDVFWSFDWPERLDVSFNTVRLQQDLVVGENLSLAHVGERAIA